MKPGEVRRVEFPQAAGHAQVGRRPAVVLQDEVYGGRSQLVVVVPLTSALSTLRFPAILAVNANPGNGLAVDSVALVFQIRALDRHFIGDVLGNIPSEMLSTIHELLDQLLGRRPLH